MPKSSGPLTELAPRQLFAAVAAGAACGFGIALAATHRRGRDVSEAERGLGVAVGSLAEAVMIQRPGRGMVYANQAAAEAMGFATPDELLRASIAEVAAGWETFNEDGSLLRAEDYPSRRVLEGELPEPLVVRTVNRVTGREFWRVIKATPVYDEAGRLAMAASVLEDITEVKRAELAQRLLAHAGEVLSSSLDYEDTLQEVARLAVPELADWCTVSIPDDRGVIQAVAVAHVDADKVRFAREYQARYARRVTDNGGAADILRAGPPQLTEEVTDAMLVESIPDPEQLAALRTIGMRSVIQAPIVAPSGPPLGVLSLINAESGRIFTQADLKLALELGRRAGTAVQNARLYAERTHIAETLQASLMPAGLPDVPGFQLSSMYRPAGEANWVGGDFYDAFELDGGWMVVVGDVAGRGAEAAARTAEARHTLRAVGELTGDPVRAVAHLNRLLAGREDLSLCTVCAVRLGEATATVVCAGHPLPFLVRGGEAREVGRWGTMLGAWEDEFTATEVALEPGDLLVLYTDGVLDARAGAERFGEDRLGDTLAGATSAADAVHRVQHALDGFQRGDQADDTAVLVLERTVVAAPAGA
jgi:PAS domain S-box-containing protein